MNQNSDDFPLAKWIFEGQNQNATYLFVIYNARNRSYEPAYVRVGESLEQKRRECNAGDYTIMSEQKL